jgi:hypothetical protein
LSNGVSFIHRATFDGDDNSQLAELAPSKTSRPGSLIAAQAPPPPIPAP